MWTRREFLKALGASGGVAAFSGTFRPLRAAFDPDLVLKLTAAPDRVPIWSGDKTRVLRFTAEVLEGRKDAVRPLPGYLGPVLELRRGERIRVHLINRIDQPTIVHWHGMLVPDSADGHPRFAVGPGDRYTYEFTVRNPAGTYLYHPHPHGMTGKQVYMGLAGLLIVRDDSERTAGLPGSDQELNLIIQDRRVGEDNQFVFRRMMMMDDMSGVLGDRVLVNGKPDAAFRVAPRPYRLRLANVSNARMYKLAWSDGRPMHVIAGDNGLFSRADGVQVRPYVVLAPFERVELYENFGRRGGGEIALVSQAFSDESMMGGMMGNGMMGGGMMGGMMGRGMMGGGMGDMMKGMMGGGQGDELLIARFTVSAGPRIRGGPLQLPEPAAPAREGKTRLHTRVAFRHMQGLLNGVAADQRRHGVDLFQRRGRHDVHAASHAYPRRALLHTGAQPRRCARRSA